MKITDLALLSLQTAFMQKDLTTQGFCAGLQPELINAAYNTYKLFIYKSIDTLNDTEFGNQLLDELAWQFHVDYYDPSADIEVKKSLVKQSIKIHQKKGTPQAVMDLLNTAFPADTLLLEWFDYNGEPYHFKIVTSSFDNYDEDKFMKALDSVKNARSYLDGIDLFTMVWNYAQNNIKRDLEIEYKPSHVAGVSGYVELEAQDASVITFSNGDELSFFA